MVQKHTVISTITPVTIAGILIMTILAATANAQKNNSTGNALQQSTSTVPMLVVKVIHEHQSNGTVRVVAIIEQNRNATLAGVPMNATSAGVPMNATLAGVPMNATSAGVPNTPTFQ